MLKPLVGYRYLNIGEIVTKDDYFNRLGWGAWVNCGEAKVALLGYPLDHGRVLFCTPLRDTPAGNKAVFGEL